MDHDATLAGTKRVLPDADDEVAVTPASLKRRRLDLVAGGDSPSTPKALSAISSAIGGIFGYGRQRPNSSHVEPSSGDATPVPEARPALPLPPPPPQPTQPAAAAKPPMSRPAIKMAALRGTKWDPDAGKPPPKKKAAPKRGPSVYRKPLEQRQGGTGDEFDVNGWDPGDSPSAPRSVNRLLGSSSKGSLLNGTRPSGDLFAAGSIHSSPSKNGLGAASPKPRGILTPTKKRGPRPSKSVSFGGTPGGGLLFEDLPTTPSSTKKRGRPPKAKKKDEEEEDGIVCGICSRPDSKPPNEIILCDNCDFAVHQECYEVPEIPTGDWLCKSCAQEDVLKLPDEKPAAEAVAAATPAAEIPDVPNLETHIRCFQRVLLDRCAGRRRIQMFGQQEAYDKARQLVEQTVLAGEGNSMLLIGARGCGKTTLVDQVVADLSQEHKHEFHVVRLNGFIHTDDRLALKEIWRQLGKEMAVEDDLVNRNNYADIMASLLALLSHPSEISGTDEGITSQSVVFVIDEFDMFASHPRQTLLYNLFDIAQSRKAPIAVMGCTTRLDVVEMLEKRVKSRFSHRYVYLSLPKTLPAFWQVCRQGLVIDKSDASKEGIDSSIEGYEAFRKYWSHKIEELYKQRPFQDLLQHHYYTTKSVSAFFAEWMLPLSCLSPTNMTLDCPSACSETSSLAAPDSRLPLLSTLSDLDLSLLIAAARLDIVAHTDNVNFAMAYDEYSSLVGRQRVQSATSGMLALGGGARVWSRGVSAIAWERLVSLGLLVPSGLGGGARAAVMQGGLGSKMWRVDVALEEIPAAARLNNVLAKWCKEI